MEKNENVRLEQYKLQNPFEGVSFVTELGKTFDEIDVTMSDTDASVREKFSERADVKKIISEANFFQIFFRQHLMGFC